MKKLFISSTIGCLILAMTNFSIPEFVYATSYGYGTAEIRGESIEIIAEPTLTIVYDEYLSENNVQGSSFYLEENKHTWAEDNVISYQESSSDYFVSGIADFHAGFYPDLYAEGSASSDNLSGAHWIQSTARMAALFHVIGSGSLSVGISYDLFTSLESTGDDEAYGFSTALVQIGTAMHGGVWSREIDRTGGEVVGTESYTDDLTGWLYTDFNFVDGDTGYFSIWAQTNYFASSPKRIAPIPEPATLILLGTGLIGLAGFRRKIKK